LRELQELMSQSTADRVQGITANVDDITLRASGRNLSLELGAGLIPTPTLKRSIEGASTIESIAEDPERRLLRHLLVSQKWDVELDGLHFRYPGAYAKQGDQSTLTLEDRWVAILREHVGPKKAFRAKVTRAEFIKMLVEEAAPNLDFYCPQLHRKQPINTKAKAKQAKKESKENLGKGIGDVKHLTVKGVAATKAQLELGELALEIAASVDAVEVVEIALICALIDENDMSEPNVLQAEQEITGPGGEGAPVGSAEEEISGFLTGRPEWTGTAAIGYHKAHPGATAAEIATAVQANEAGASVYARYEGEARKWVKAYGGGEGSESIDVTQHFTFEVKGKGKGRKKPENYWEAIQRLAKDVNWRAFIIGRKFFYMPEPEILQGAVRLAIDGNTPGIEDVNFEYDGNSPVTEVEVEALVSEWGVPPGAVFTLADYGPASIGFGDAPVKKGGVGISSNRNAQTGEGAARYLVTQIEVPLSNDPAQRVAIITGKKPTAPLPEPANEVKSFSTSTGRGGYVNPLPHGEWTRSRTDMGVDFVNDSAASKILAIGDAKILKLGAPGWPGEGGVLYELLNGSRKGQFIYVYENVLPHVGAGQAVSAGDVIATMKGTGYPWLEIGFSDSNGSPLASSTYSEGDETKPGKEMAKFLDSLGAP
jgi:murein DD-endopeptidase MepM/ murein hydrolase activator NlpD